jgi:hypothetical protein
MINSLTGLGFGIISLAIVIGIGIVILVTLGSNLASCPTTYSTYNSTSLLCSNGTAQISPSTATSTINTLSTYLGTGSGGLATWVPIIIVLVVGLMFLGAFAVKKGRMS